MTFGEKLSKLRKEANYTQEQLADVLGVSRQSISKWESDIAYPETDKLIRMGGLFGCSMDYLLKEEVTEKQGTAPREEAPREGAAFRRQWRALLRERKSEKTVLGMPLYHIGRNAHGVFAVGLRARGIFSLGLLSCGVISLGLLSLGVVSFGLLALGMLSFGTLAVGLLAAGAIALGLVAAGAVSVGIASFGACSVGCFSTGALAIGKYLAIGDYARAAVAIGKTEAQGSVYQCFGSIPPSERTQIAAWLDANVPPLLGWAKAIFQLFLR
ncbi:MAG: helix-turn-helix transcriptional regulator [Clostridia bacterium]|nr:helix-turn-helix transcriptional regulator [Clostridia bacterium]